MKNSVFASLFIEALNNADDDNETAHKLSDMLSQIEKRKIAEHSRNADKKASGRQNSSSHPKGSQNNSAPHQQNKLRNSYRPYQEEKAERERRNTEHAFARELKQKEYQDIVAGRPYYFLSLDGLMAVKNQAKHIFERAKVKYASPEKKAKLKQTERTYQWKMGEAEREIQLKVKARLEKGQKIPRSLMVNDGFVLSEEGMKRDERRKQLIAEEAQAATAHREAISKVTVHAKPNLVPAVTSIEVAPLPLLVTGGVGRSRIPSVAVAENVDRLLYFQLIRIMSRDDAWRIAKNKTLSDAYRTAPFQPSGASYIHSLCYQLLINSGAAREDALSVAKSREKAETYLRENIADQTKNRIFKPKKNLIKRNAASCSNSRSAIPITRYHQFNIIDTGMHRYHVFTRTPMLQASFKSRVLANFDHTCAVTGQKVGALLQACHIEDYASSSDMSTDNGILLSADCHRLFDEGLMGIDPEKLTVHFKVQCIYASLFEGKKIAFHRLALNKEKLTTRWKVYNEK